MKAGRRKTPEEGVDGCETSRQRKSRVKRTVNGSGATKRRGTIEI